MEMGDEFPQCDIIGTDLSPIQPEIVNPNVKFYIDDACVLAGPAPCLLSLAVYTTTNTNTHRTEEWQQGPEWHNLDYIHTRMTAGCWSDMASQLIKPAFDRLRPGGWLESQEMGCWIECDDGTYTGGPLGRMCEELVNASEDAGRSVNIGSRLKQWYEEAGFVDVEELIFKIPLNPWPPIGVWKQIGHLWFKNIYGGLPALAYALLHRCRGMTQEEIEVSITPVVRW